MSIEIATPSRPRDPQESRISTGIASIKYFILPLLGLDLRCWFSPDLVSSSNSTLWMALSKFTFGFSALLVLAASPEEES